jgi:glycine/D-amino acid oxidase-like deaminating enzyme
MPKKNKSPWIHQLDHERPIDRLAEDAAADVAVIGAGIAGVATAYFTLSKTQKSVIHIERARLAHGASGHNAGLIVADFERPLPDLEREFGFERAAEALRCIERGWALLDEMYHGAGLDIPLSRFTEETGLLDADHVKLFAAEADFRRRAGLPFFPVKVARGRVAPEALAALDPALYAWVDEADIRAALECENDRYVGLAEEPAGVANSALLCQEVIRFLQRAYPGRYRLVEETKIEKVVLKDSGVVLDAGVATVSCGEVVLCTNGFEDFTIIGEGGLCLDKEFHRNVRGIVGYMSGYLVPMRRPPAGLVYLESEGFSEDEAYYYVTRRPYEYERGTGARHNLISAGGPQVLLESHTDYSFDDEYPGERAAEIQRFVDATYGKDTPGEKHRLFAWHGLMGYTRGMVRMVGPHPASPRLLYNLGCNGIGLLPSIWGGETVARHLAGEAVPRTIFTPDAGTC